MREFNHKIVFELNRISNRRRYLSKNTKYLGFLFAIIGVSFLFFPTNERAEGHGVGGELLSPVSIGYRNATIYLSIQPPVFDPDDEEQWITVNFFDADTEAVIEHVTYMIELSKDEQRLFRYMFHDDLGKLALRVNSTDSEKIIVHGSTENVLGGWMREGIETITIEGPIFSSGGLYDFDIEIVTLDSDTTVLDVRPKYRGSISVADRTDYDVQDSKGVDYKMAITSWYDKIEDFEYEPDSKTVTFSMPFDWSKENVEQVSVVHEEVHVPKTFADLLVTKYDVTVNGITLPGTSVVPDDYSDEDRIVHIILPQENIMSIQESAVKESPDKMIFSLVPNKEIEFPLSQRSPEGDYQVDLWWEPERIKSEQNTKFYLDIKELFVGDPQDQIKYDFVLRQNGTEIYRNSSSDLEEDTDVQEFVFLRDDLGPISISIQNIAGNKVEEIDFLTTVEPQEIQRPEFPIKLESKMINANGEIVNGSYYVDITWFSHPLKINDESEFIITIYDKNSGLPVFASDYDFVLLQQGNEIYRTKGFAKAGGSFENFKFTKDNLGEITVRVENIASSKEFVEIPINVTPEFSSILLLMPILFILPIILLRIKNTKILKI